MHGRTKWSAIGHTVTSLVIPALGCLLLFAISTEEAKCIESREYPELQAPADIPLVDTSYNITRTDDHERPVSVLVDNNGDTHILYVDYLLKRGHIVPTAHLSSLNVMDAEIVIHPPDVYQRDVDWVAACDALIAEVSTPSHGVGYEIALALSLDKPVLCCFQKGKTVSKMILGNTHRGILVRDYESLNELGNIIDEFLDNPLLR